VREDEARALPSVKTISQPDKSGRMISAPTVLTLPLRVILASCVHSRLYDEILRSAQDDTAECG
jgi:hypothetical protein